LIQTLRQDVTLDDRLAIDESNNRSLSIYKNSMETLRLHKSPLGPVSSHGSISTGKNGSEKILVGTQVRTHTKLVEVVLASTRLKQKHLTRRLVPFKNEYWQVPGQRSGCMQLPEIPAASPRSKWESLSPSESRPIIQNSPQPFHGLTQTSPEVILHRPGS
jgi:hypothetical protein